MIEKHERLYIKQWFNKDQKFEQGDKLIFDMPPFCSGNYTAKIYLDNDGDAYIKKSKDYSSGCNNVFILHKNKVE